MSQSPSILFINQHYWPDCAATAQMLTDLAEYLAAAGADVHVLCSRGHYLSGSMEVPAEETHNGVHIHRVRATAFGRGTTLGRLTDYASFGASVLTRVLTGPSYDYIVTLTTPPLLPLVGTTAQLLRDQAYGIWSMDLHPDAEVASGMFAEGGLPARLLHALNDTGYRNAEFVVDLGLHMKRRLREKGVAADRLYTIPVWSKKEEIAPVPHEENPLRSDLGLDDKFVVMYSGNAGVAHRFEEVLAVMKRLDGHPEIEFVFVGEGPRKERIEAFAEEHDLSNFRYLPYFPREELQRSLPMADVHLLTLREEMAGIAVPGKLYGIMAAGRPVLMVGPGASGRTRRAVSSIQPRRTLPLRRSTTSCCPSTNRILRASGSARTGGKHS
jgi:glycosyltransferase involved in cell wall biosynthesis